MVQESVWVRQSATVPLDTLSTTPIELSQDTIREVLRIARFALIVCHELRTPLTSLITSLGTLQEMLQPKEESMEGKLIRNALRSALTLKARTDGMQDIVNFRAGIAKLEKGTVDVAHLVRGAAGSVSTQASAAGVEVRVNVPEGLPPFTGDAYRLEQVVRNLIQNALDYASSGRAVDVRARCGDGAMIIEVQDYGPGISPEMRMKIFEPGYQEASKSGEVAGMGIGLEMSKVLVEMHGGRIVVVSEEGKGSLFRVELPLAPPCPANELPRSGSR